MSTVVNAPALPVSSGLRRREGFSTSLRVAIALALLVLTLFPLYWTIISSLKTNLETHAVPVTFVPAVT